MENITHVYLKCILLSLIFKFIMVQFSYGQEAKSWEPESFKNISDPKTKEYITKIWNFYLEGKLNSAQFKSGEYLLQQSPDQLDEIDTKIRDAFVGVAKGELDPDKLDRVVNMIESPEDKVKRMKLKEVQRQERTIEFELQKLFDEFEIQKTKNGDKAHEILQNVKDIDPDNPKLMKLLDELNKLYEINIEKDGTFLSVNSGGNATKSFTVKYLDGEHNAQIVTSLDSDVRTWQGFKRYDLGHVEKILGSNSGRLHLSILIDGKSVYVGEFKGEEIAYLGRNATSWDIPTFDKIDYFTYTMNCDNYIFTIILGSSGKRDRSQPSTYPNGYINKGYVTIKYSRRFKINNKN